VFALNLDSGEVLWSQQLLARDIWLWPSGPDQDIAASVIVSELPDGRRLAIVGQKSMGVWAFDPDHDGALLWHQSNLQPNTKPGTGGEIVFGGAVDDKNVYFALTESSRSNRTGGLVALDLATGRRHWYRAVPPQQSLRDHPGISAAISMIPGVIFTGGLDGALRAFSTIDGSVLWSFDTTRKFKTVNGLAGQGGSIGSAGPVIAGGSVFVASGYVGFQNGVPGNILLAFSP
jgi:polyvinyl alcohol dehydrogenase (cytochrome)